MQNEKLKMQKGPSPPYRAKGGRDKGGAAPQNSVGRLREE
jgi:hypothetical protein